METSPTSPWLTLTDLGRLYGISAVHCGHLLAEAGLRGPDGHPSAAAVAAGQAYARHPRHQGRPVLWHREACGAALESRGLMPLGYSTLVHQWADLLAALEEGSAAISTSPAQMAEEMPPALVDPVNRELRAMGCDFQVSEAPMGRSLTAATPAQAPKAAMARVRAGGGAWSGAGAAPAQGGRRGRRRPAAAASGGAPTAAPGCGATAATRAANAAH